MEARKTHQRHMAGTAMGLLIAPSKGIRDDILRNGGKLKDHITFNKKQLKLTQKANQSKKLEQVKPEPFRLSQFANVPKRVDTRGSTPLKVDSLTQEPSKRNYINENTRRVREMSLSSRTTTATNSPLPETKPVVPDLQRRAILEQFQQSILFNSEKDSLMDSLHKFPIVIELASVKQRKIRVEEQIAQAEQKIDLFSRSKVYVTQEEYGNLENIL